MRQYRSEQRKPLHTTADLSWEIGAGYTRSGKATVQDISRSGMGLLVQTPLAVGAALKIKTEDNSYTAIVRRSIRQGVNFLLGVQFQR
jgi:hypothetical protein